MRRRVAQGRQQRAPQLPLPRARRPGSVATAAAIDAVALALDLVAHQQQEHLLQRIGAQSRRVIFLVALDERVAPEQLRYASKGPGVDAVHEERLE